MSNIRLGVIGAGNIAIEHLKVIQASDDLEVMGIASRTRAKAETLAADFKIAAVFDSPEALIVEGRPDAVLVLVSADQIYAVTKQIIGANIPFLVEKPPGLTPDETGSLAQLARRQQTPNMVGYNRRYYSVFHKGLAVIEAHGRLLGVAVEGHERFWNIAGRVNDRMRDHWIFANSTHTIDLLRLFGGEIKTISTLQKGVVEQHSDQFAAVMEFESGALGNYLAHWYSPGGWAVRLFGEGVTVEFKPLESGVWMTTDFKAHTIEPDPVDSEYKPGFYRQMQAFGALVRTGRLEWPAQDLAAAHATMTLAGEIAGRRKGE